MTNYICINGKKAELTEEQMKALGIELPKASPFDRAEYNGVYYFINNTGDITSDRDISYMSDDIRFNTANYCTNKAIMEQRALHETLNRLLWRYSMEHDGDKIDWSSDCTSKYRIRYDGHQKKYEVEKNQFLMEINTVYFYNCSIALNAIKDIIEPFMKAYPEFKW